MFWGRFRLGARESLSLSSLASTPVVEGTFPLTNYWIIFEDINRITSRLNL